ncbi:MAG TPA: hypothetical protein VLB69_09055 [Rudaea sp.]|nr:hypothetical protein [Rudaea sp.]
MRQRRPKQTVFNVLFALAATGACCAAAMAMDTVKTTPSSSEISPQQWRAQQLAAADKSDAIMRDAQKQPGLLAQYAHMQQAYDANHDRAFQLIFGQYLSWYQTYIGDYNAARSTFSIAQPAQDSDGPSPLNGGYQLRPAADVILEMAKDRKAVFFNEAHSAPITRTLTIQLLARLREEGFDYFAAETLYPTDKDLNKRGYPTAESGFYTNEPLYAEMVRTALRLGYTVVAYDAENAGVGDPRERAGAQNLYNQVFRKDPKARLIVNAGFAHVQKSGKYLGGTSMGEFFHKISGIDPLTIEQTMLIQHARPDQDHPYYLAVTQAQHLKQPSVFVSGGKAWTLKPGQYDMSVFFPPQESGERPDWLRLGGLRVAYDVGGEMCNAHFPCLVEARYANEGADGIPADRIVLNVVEENAPAASRLLIGHGSASGRLFLRPAKYHLTAMDKSGRTVFAKDIDVTADTAAKP